MNARRNLVKGLLAAATMSTIAGAQDIERVLTELNFSTFGAPIATADAEAIAASPSGQLYLFNGGDTDDGDGDAVATFSVGAPGALSLAMCDGGQIEAAIAAAGGSLVNSLYRGTAVDAAGNVLIPIDPNGVGEAWLVRVNASSSFAAPSVDVLAGGPTAGNAIDGTWDIEVVGSTIFLLQRQENGAPEDRIVSFNSTGSAFPTLQSPTVVVNAATLGATIPATENMNGLAALGGNLLILDGGSATASDTVYTVPQSGGAVTVFKSNASLVSELGASFVGFSTGSVTVNPSTNDVYFSGFDDGTAGWNLFKIDGTTNTASTVVTEAVIEADADYGAANGEITDQVYGLAYRNDGYVYFTYEASSGNDEAVLRVSVLAPSGAASWVMYE